MPAFRFHCNFCCRKPVCSNEFRMRLGTVAFIFELQIKSRSYAQSSDVQFMPCTLECKWIEQATPYLCFQLRVVANGVEIVSKTVPLRSRPYGKALIIGRTWAV